MTSYRAFLLPMMAVLVLGGGCARHHEPSTGFLGDYTRLRPGVGSEAQMVYINPAADFATYDKVLLEPISLWLVDEASLADIPDADLHELVNYLHTAVHNQLAQDYEIVSEKGPGVLAVRMAITEARGATVLADVGTVSRTGNPWSVGKLATDTHWLVGKSGLEVEVLDSVTGEQLGAAVDERAGTKVLLGDTNSWADVHASYDYWAGALRGRLARLRAGVHEPVEPVAPAAQ